MYRIAEVPLRRFVMPVIESNMYVLSEGEEALVIDPHPSPAAEALLRDRGVTRCLVLLTHEHYDHISGVNWLRSLFPCRVVCTEACAERIASPKTNSAKYFPALLMDRPRQEQERFAALWDGDYACRADMTYSGVLSLEWRSLPLTLRSAPGHSPGGQLITLCGRHVFTGDNLIPGQDVLTRLPGGSKAEFREKTLPLLRALHPDSVIYPGHGDVQDGISL